MFQWNSWYSRHSHCHATLSFISDVVDLYRVLLSQPATPFFHFRKENFNFNLTKQIGLAYQAQNDVGQIIKHQYKLAVQDCHEKRANCPRKVREIESRSWERWLGWRGWRMIICKRPLPKDDHLQEARSSGWSFASGQILWMIICKWPVPPNDHLQVAGSSGWLFARGPVLWTIICKWPDPQDDHLQEARSCEWSFAFAFASIWPKKPLLTTGKMRKKGP